MLAGMVVAIGMLLLGRWQLDVYHEQGAQASAARAAAPAIPLAEAAPADGSTPSGYGRSVLVSGHWDPDRQLLLPQSGGGFRVLTALRGDDGRTVAVIRGSVSGDSAPAPPPAPVRAAGVLLPSEDDPGPSTGDRPSVVRVAALAQTWPPPMVDGFVTLSPDDAYAQGLAPAAVALPQSGGRLRNGAYAVQWVLFAGFALVMSIRMARDLGRPGDADADLINE